ncbi:MAG: response regulator [Gemmatimonadetes bacterium]|nr:response regulator [Gemmatimonadota bacterium]
MPGIEDSRKLGNFPGRASIDPLRVLLVDDHALFRRGLRELLEQHGVEVVDVSDPLNPRLVGFHDTHPGAANDDLLFDAAPTGGLQAAHEKGEGVFEGAWGVHWDDTGRIVVSDMQQGLFVLRYTGP